MLALIQLPFFFGRDGPALGGIMNLSNDLRGPSCALLLNTTIFLFLILMRPFKNPQSHKSQDPLQDINSNRKRIAAHCLACTLEATSKRIKWQALTSLIVFSTKQDQRSSRLRFVVFISSCFLKRQKLIVLNRLLRANQHDKVLLKAVTNFTLCCKRIFKNTLRHSLSKLQSYPESKPQFTRTSNQRPITPLISPRVSESSERSNIFSVSDSENEEPAYQDTRHYDRSDESTLKRENEELKRMVLSESARESLLKMQRYNRFNYNTETERVLKGPITDELRRLERMKNEQKDMRSKFYDNELTITCLYNHIRIISQMNQDIAESKTYKDKCAELEKKLSEVGFEHKRQINQFKRKLLISGVKLDMSPSKLEPSPSKLQSSPNANKGERSQTKNSSFTHEEVTTLNVLANAIKAKKYKDIKRQVDHLLKTSQKLELISLMKELLIFMEDMEAMDEGGRQKDKEKVQIINVINLIDKHLRAEKTDDLEALKNKSKAQAHLNQLCVLIDTIIGLSKQLKTIKKRQSTSADRFKSAEKEKIKKTIEKENQQLKRQVKSLQAKNRELSVELDRIKESLKKVDRVHPSLLPKKQTQKDLPIPQIKSDDVNKKIKEVEINYSKKLEGLSKQYTLKLEKSKQIEEKLENKIKDLQQQLQNKKREEVEFKAIKKELQDFKKAYSALRQKMKNKETYTKDLNQFKRVHRESTLAQILQDIIAEQSNKTALLNQLRSTKALFQDGGWRRRQNNILVKSEEEIYAAVNQLLEMLLGLSKEKDEYAASTKQVTAIKQREIRITEQNKALKEEIIGLKTQIRKQKEQLQINLNQKQQPSSTPMKSRTPERIQRSSGDKQMSQLLAENQKLKKQLQSRQASLSVGHQLQQSKILSKEYEDAVKCFQIIKKKKIQKQSYQVNVTSFKKNHHESLFSELFQALSAEDASQLRVITSVRSVASAFSDGSWKRKQNSLKTKEQVEPFLSLNQIIELLTNLFREKEEISKQIKETEVIKSQNTSLSTEIMQLKQDNQKIKKEAQQMDAALSRERSNSKAQRSTEQKTKVYQIEIDRLKHEVEQKNVTIVNLEVSVSQLSDQAKIAEQLQDLMVFWGQMKSKISSGMTCQKEITSFNRSHPKSSCKDILQSLVNAEGQALTLANHLKKIVEVFSGDSCTKKISLAIKENKPYHDYLNQLVQLMLSIKAEKEQLKTENLTAQNQINLSQREIQELREEILRLKTTHARSSPKQLSPSKQISLEQHRQLNQLKLLNDNLTIENSRLNAELENAIKTNGISNSEIDMLTFQLSKLKKETSQFKQAESYERNKDIEIQRMQNKINELQLNLQNSEEKVKNYTALFEKYKEERNSLYMMIEERQQQYELSKENEELHIKEKQERDEKIFELRHRYEETQLNIKEIQREVDRLLAEREHLNMQRQTTEQTLRRALEQQQKQLATAKVSLIQKQKMSYALQNKLEMTQMRSKNELAMKQNQIQYLHKEILILKQQISQLKRKLLEQRKELRDRCQSLNKELMEQRRFREEERTLFKQRIQQYSQVQIGKGSTTFLLADDQEKKELRKQLELVNQQLAHFVRNSENQKRQMRQYVDKINNDMQMQTVLFNEEKKILKEGIERARNQEYQIHHQKLKKLREDIQALREENQRLISIIDNNETAFNDLINEHREMSITISELRDINNTLTDQNAQLGQQLSHANKDKENLSFQLKVLQDRLVVLERDITSAIEDKGANDQEFLSSQVREQELRDTISQLTHEKKVLQSKMIQQNKESVELYKQILRLESDLQRSAASHQNRQSQGGYSLYLEEKLNHTQKEIQRYIENEKNLITKIENLMKNVSSLEREKVEYYSSRREKQIELALQRSNNQKQILYLQQKIVKLEEALAQQQREFTMEKSQHQPHSGLQQIENKLALQITHNKKLVSDIQKLQAIIQLLKRQRTHLQIKIDSNSKANIEAKLIGNKYADLQLQFKQLEAKARASQDEAIFLKKQLSQRSRSSQPTQQFDFLTQRSALLKKDQEIMWLNSQLSSREHQVQKLRSVDLELSHTVKRLEEKLVTMEHFQMKYTRQLNSHDETRRQKQDVQQFYKHQLSIARVKQRQASESLILCNENLRVLNQSYQQLSIEYKHLKDEAQNRKAESQALREIVFQLDSEYVFEDNDEELQLKILQKISQQITQLLDSNKQLKAKCQNLELSIFENSTEASQQTVIYSLHTMTENLLLYLQAEALLTAQSVTNNLRQLLIDSNNTLQTYISNLEVFLKTLIASLKEKSSEQSLDYHYRIENIRRAVQNYVNYSTSENLSKLKETL